MKMHYYLTIAFILFSLNAFSQSDDDLLDYQKLGLISYLTYIKSSAEQTITKKGTEALIEDYNNLKIEVEILINQLSIDMIDRNGIRVYRQLNKLVKENNEANKENKHYKQFNKIKGKYKNIKAKYKTIKDKNQKEMTPADYIGAVTLVHGILTDARDAREKKVQAVIVVLEKVRLEEIKVKEIKEGDTKK